MSRIGSWGKVGSLGINGKQIKKTSCPVKGKKFVSYVSSAGKGEGRQRTVRSLSAAKKRRSEGSACVTRIQEENELC